MIAPFGGGGALKFGHPLRSASAVVAMPVAGTGLDEPVIVGLPAAIFTAMFNATGNYVTDLAITREGPLWRYA
jgi:CO/xanthine dehydrogenase Mo-binding subunit